MTNNSNSYNTDDIEVCLECCGAGDLALEDEHHSYVEDECEYCQGAGLIKKD